ncbi:hypothetical protein ABPG77_006260 [Micractinium sp. CCAP 211/92]
MSTGAEDLSARLRALLAQLFSLQDPDVLSYLAAGLEEDEDVDADELSDSLAGFSPSFAAQSPAEQQKQVNSLLQRVAQLKTEASAAAASAAAAVAAGEAIAPVGSGCAAAKPALAAVVSQTLSRLSSLSVGGAGSGAAGSAATSECGSSDDEGRSYAWTPEQQAAVCTLRELCALPADASDAFLAHLLASKGGGSLEAAAAWMLECEDLEAEEASWRQAVQRRREERAREAVERGATKKQIVERFALQAVPDSGGAGKGKPPALQAWGAGGKGKCGGDGGKVRYRDGMVATRAGQKYVLEAKDEWDGGSRGKVYTKGKRGKGFV